MSGINEYSTTPGSNGTINSINVAENCPAGGINNAIRQMAADMRSYANDAEWFQYGDGDGTATFTYVSATSFKLSSVDVSTEYHVGRRVKASGSTTGTIYGTISTVAYSTDTTVTVDWDGDDDALSNETLTVWLAINSVTNTSLPVASSSAKGIAELATTTETLTGTDSARAVTPDALAALWEKGSDIASAATISIGEGGYFHVTGTTAITDIDFGTDKSGRAVWLIFDGAVKLTHNATTLAIQGGADYTTAAGDMALVVSDNGSDNVKVLIFPKSGKAVVSLTRTTYTSSDTAIALNGATDFTHGLGALPTSWRVLMVNTSAELGYSVGDLVDLSTCDSVGTASNNAPNVSPSSTAITVICGITWAIHHKSTGAGSTIDTTKWKLRVLAELLS